MIQQEASIRFPLPRSKGVLQQQKIDPSYYNLFERAEENHAAKYGQDPNDATRPVRDQVQNFTSYRIDGKKLTAVTYEIDQNLNNKQPFIVDQFGIVKDYAPVTEDNGKLLWRSENAKGLHLVHSS